ncbi:transcription factor bHLH160 [Benincasa hispida]|uniref:transcription factor bHLH160 n=1 Tax=Benincasa hispida TaxID=102211 RepID=UPI001902BD73|nr:transcription factor bHLH160 [Benincasa hispida]
MSLTQWEEYILMNENNGISEIENPELLGLSLSSLSNNNGELEETQLSENGEALLSDEILGSLMEAATLLGLEENIDGVLEKESSKLIPSSIINANIEPSIANKANAKKEEHNARERQRRMQLSHSYFSLRSLLPNARRSKKRWSSGTIIDKVVDYIPTLQKEIENMNQKKQKLIKAKEMSNERVLLVDENEGLNNNPTVSIHQLCKGEVIIQICINQRNNNVIINFSNLIQKAQAEGLCIIGASTVSVSHDHLTLSFHLHIQMDRSVQEAADYKSILRKKLTVNNLQNEKGVRQERPEARKDEKKRCSSCDSQISGLFFRYCSLRVVVLVRKLSP